MSTLLLLLSVSVLGERGWLNTQVATILFPVAYSAYLVLSFALLVIALVLVRRVIRSGVGRARLLIVVSAFSLATLIATSVEYSVYRNAVEDNGGEVGLLSSIASAGAMSSPDAEATYVGSGGESRSISIYTPPAGVDAPAPVFVYIHGGGWSSGNADSASNFHRMMADSGYVVFSINYDLATDDHPTWDTAIEDCNNAITWVRDNAQDYGGDPTQFVISGESAGGTLALVYAGRTSEGTLDGPRPAAVSVLFPAVDLRWTSQNGRYLTPFVLPGIVEKYIGGSLVDYPDRLAAVSPMTFINAQMPPVLIIHGQKDSLVTVTGSEEYVDALSGLGVETRLAEIPYTNHGTAATVNRDLTLHFLEQLR